jgi:endonuclease YncB( thermonuclease family)
VVDGDTIEVEVAGQRKTVRYIGVNTPETVAPNRPVQCYGPEASTANKAMVEGKIVYLEKDVSETDSFGRLLRYVYRPEAFVNAELVKQGYAQAATYPPDVKYTQLFVQLEEQARSAGRGLWGNVCKATPTPTVAPKPAATKQPTRQPTSRPPTPRPPTPVPPPSGGVCGTSYSPNGPDRDCPDFSSQAGAVLLQGGRWSKPRPPPPGR